MKQRALILDIGSNSTKCLVAERAATAGCLQVVHQASREARISRGIGSHPPRLQPEAIRLTVEAVRQLWQECRPLGPFAACRIVATSAVRSAVNGHEFTNAVRWLTGEEVGVLTGEEEAAGIARGVRTDPAIGALQDFTVFDLGGGSLELIHFTGGSVLNHTSLPLGSVRLAERFFRDPSAPIPQSEQDALAEAVDNSLLHCGVTLRLPLVGCSGGLAALAPVYSQTNREGRQCFPFETLADLTRRACACPRAERVSQLHLVPERADIYPAGLLLISSLMRLTNAGEVLHSTHNLRFGLAADILL